MTSTSQEERPKIQQLYPDRMTDTERMLLTLWNGPDCFEFASYEISGFGRNTTYEMGCQRMLYLGMKWLKGKPLRIFDGMHGYAGIIGVQSTEGSQLGELEDIWDDDAFLKSGGISGAMHQFVLRHLKYIQEEGYEAWLKETDAPFKVRMWP